MIPEDEITPCRMLGYRHVIVTTEVMIDIIKYIYLTKSNKVHRILLSSPFDSKNNEIAQLVHKTNANSAYLVVLIDTLRKISEISSVAIELIKLNDCIIHLNGKVYENKPSQDIINVIKKSLV